jgi:hypothetical protein
MEAHSEVDQAGHGGVFASRVPLRGHLATEWGVEVAISEQSRSGQSGLLQASSREQRDDVTVQNFSSSCIKISSRSDGVSVKKSAQILSASTAQEREREREKRSRLPANKRTERKKEKERGTGDAPWSVPQPEYHGCVLAFLPATTLAPAIIEIIPAPSCEGKILMLRMLHQIGPIWLIQPMVPQVA